MSAPKPGAVQQVSDITFRRILDATRGKLVVLDCFAEWCPPCREAAPQFEKLAKEFNDVVFLKANMDDCDDIGRQHQITEHRTGAPAGDVASWGTSAPPSAPALTAAQREHAETLSAVVGITAAQAQALLQAYEWNVDIAASEYLANPAILETMDVAAAPPAAPAPGGADAGGGGGGGGAGTGGGGVGHGPWHGELASIQFRIGTSRISHKFPSDAHVSDLTEFARCILPPGTPFHLATRVAGAPQRLNNGDTLAAAGLTPRGLCLVEAEGATTLLPEKVPTAIERVPAAQQHQ